MQNRPRNLPDQRHRPAPAILLGAFLIAVMAWPLPAAAQNRKPYDEQLLRLSEILGNLHYLRELCGTNDGQLWRLAMQDLIEVEGGVSRRRRLRLTKEFNTGYRAYKRTYNKCTPSAQTAIAHLLDKGALISDTMVRKIR